MCGGGPKTMKNKLNRCSVCRLPTESPYDRVCPASGCKKMHRKRLQLVVKERKAFEERFMRRLMKQIREELARPDNEKLFSDLLDEELAT
jgi:hypothetical protein